MTRVTSRHFPWLVLLVLPWCIRPIGLLKNEFVVLPPYGALPPPYLIKTIDTSHKASILEEVVSSTKYGYYTGSSGPMFVGMVKVAMVVSVKTVEVEYEKGNFP